MRASEDLTEVPEMRAGIVLDETKRVRAGWGERSTDVVLTQPVQLPQQYLTRTPQVPVQLTLDVQRGHVARLVATAIVSVSEHGDGHCGGAESPTPGVSLNAG